MTIELVFNALMLFFFSYCYFYIGATLPPSANTELGAEQWPQIILALLVLMLIINIVKILKNLKTAPAEKQLNVRLLKGFFTSKLFIGILIIFVLVILLGKIGFIPSCILFLIAYSRLLGEKRWHISLICAVVITAILFILFYKGLSIMLPRGEGIFRTFALLLESI